MDRRNMGHRRDGCAVLAGVFGVLLLLCAPASAEEGGPWGILSSWTADTVTTRTFTWRDSAQQDECLQVVREADYQSSGFAEAVEFEAQCRDISLDGSGQWNYEATAVDLIPETSYVYRVGCQGNWSEECSFLTLSEDGDGVLFAYLGDAQTAGDTAQDYAAWASLVQSVWVRNPELAFAVLGGDNVNSGISVDEFDLFRASATSVFSSLPLFSTVGNHESNFIGGKPELYLDEFAFPANGPEDFEEEFYSFDVGNCHILVLNSWALSGEQTLTETDLARVRAWMAADLSGCTADWQIAVTHVPVYALHSDGTSTKLRENWAEILEQYGVDLVFEGHQHVYSRSYPLYQGQIDYERGITYIMGVSGSKFYDSADESFAERTIYNTATCQLTRVDGDSLTVQTVDSDGTELDFASITQRAVTATRAEFVQMLWQAAGEPAPTGDSPFTDTDDPAVAWSYEQGYCYGYGNGCFGSDDVILPYQTALILERMEVAS